MVVSAVMEKSVAGGNSESEDSGAETRNPRLRPLNKQYYGLAGITPDNLDTVDSDGGAVSSRPDTQRQGAGQGSRHQHYIR